MSPGHESVPGGTTLPKCSIFECLAAAAWVCTTTSNLDAPMWLCDAHAKGHAKHCRALQAGQAQIHRLDRAPEAAP